VLAILGGLPALPPLNRSPSARQVKSLAAPTPTRLGNIGWLLARTMRAQRHFVLRHKRMYGCWLCVGTRRNIHRPGAPLRLPTCALQADAVNLQEIGVQPWLALSMGAVLLAACAIEIPLLWHYAARYGSVSQRRDPLITVATLAVVAALILMPSRVGSLGFPTAFAYAGVFVAACGAALRGWAILYLGRWFATTLSVAEDHALVTTGPYRFVRHPAYTGAVLLFLGLALTFDSWVALVAAAALIPAVYLRVGQEERLLRAAFGAAFDQYARRTPRFAPLRPFRSNG
jgi:protein-S-isoprenylcysteine O-methyltransferase Ste14